MQSTIKYENGNWVLEDGRDGKESTNGTWYYLNQEQDIQDGMIFKQNQTFFVANFNWAFRKLKHLIISKIMPLIFNYYKFFS